MKTEREKRLDAIYLRWQQGKRRVELATQVAVGVLPEILRKHPTARRDECVEYAFNHGDDIAAIRDKRLQDLKEEAEKRIAEVDFEFPFDEKAEAAKWGSATQTFDGLPKL